MCWIGRLLFSRVEQIPVLSLRSRKIQNFKHRYYGLCYYLFMIAVARTFLAEIEIGGINFFASL